MFCGKKSDGSLDITSRTIPDIKAAFAAFSVMRNINRQDVAQAHIAGQKKVLEVLERATNQPPTLPNNVSSEHGTQDMTLERAQALMNLDTRNIPKDSDLAKEWQKAQDFIFSYKEE